MTCSSEELVQSIGISAFAVEALTDLVFMQLPEVGRKVKPGESFGEIESVKAVSDLYSPVDGEVIATHGDPGWAPYDDRRTTMRFDVESEPIEDLAGAERELWDGIR